MKLNISIEDRPSSIANLLIFLDRLAELKADPRSTFHHVMTLQERLDEEIRRAKNNITRNAFMSLWS